MLRELGFKEARLMPCVFFFHSSTGKLIGLVALHVDDGLAAGAPEMAPVWEKQQQALNFGVWRSNMRMVCRHGWLATLHLHRLVT